MEKIFSTQSDWFETKVIPAIRKRTIYAVIVLVLCSIGWLYYDSWIPLVVGAIVVAERAFEFSQIPTTKKIISSNSVVVTETGLSFIGSEIKGSVLYPWASLSFKIQKNNGRTPVSITINDENRKGSKIKLSGYEAMDELIAYIEDNAVKS